MEIAKENNLIVIEDVAQAPGARTNGQLCGTIGDMGVFSFQETKHITTLGEGGMIITNNEEFAEKCRSIRNHGEYYKDNNFAGLSTASTPPACFSKRTIGGKSISLTCVQ